MNYEQEFRINLKKPYTIISNNPPEMISAMKLRTIHTPILVDNGLNWKIEVDEFNQMDDNVLGTCYYDTKTILINPMVFYVMTYKQCRELLIHETAHCLCPNEEHSEVWKAKCLELGGTGKAMEEVKEIKCVNEERKLYQITF